jgi:hypothetical protein
VADIQAEDAYGRARRDAAFLQRVRDAHTGRWDVLDALWWDSHPFEPAPSGTPAPAAELRELQRRLFSQDGDASGDHVTTALMRESEATISVERAEIQDAIHRAQSTSERHAHSTDADVECLSEVDRMPETGDPAAVAPPVMNPALSPKRNLAVAVGIVAAVIGGMAVGAQLTNGTDAAPPGASPTPMNTASPVVMLEAAPLALAVFDRPQEPIDVPSVPMPEALDLESFRAIDAASSQLQNGEAGRHDHNLDRFFAARTTSHLVCLVAVVSSIDYLSTCTLENDFPATGLRLYWPGSFTMENAEGTVTTTAMERYTVWQPDGSLEGGGMGR